MQDTDDNDSNEPEPQYHPDIEETVELIDHYDNDSNELDSHGFSWLIPPGYALDEVSMQICDDLRKEFPSVRMWTVMDYVTSFETIELDSNVDEGTIIVVIDSDGDAIAHYEVVELSSDSFAVRRVEPVEAAEKIRRRNVRQLIDYELDVLDVDALEDVLDVVRRFSDSSNSEGENR